MKCQQQLSVRSSAGVLEAPSGYALRGLQCIKAKRTVYVLQNRTILFATNNNGKERLSPFRNRFIGDELNPCHPFGVERILAAVAPTGGGRYTRLASPCMGCQTENPYFFEAGTAGPKAVQKSIKPAFSRPNGTPAKPAGR